MSARSNSVVAAQISDSGAFGRSVLQAATLAAGRETMRLYTRYVDAHPGDSAPDLRRDAVQAAIDAVVTSGIPARIVIDEPGVWDILGSSTPGYIYSNTRACLLVSDLPAGTVFEIGAGVTLRLPDDVMNDGAGLAYLMIVGDAPNLDFMLCGDGTIDMNSENQPNWTGGYIQLLSSMGWQFSCETGSGTTGGFRRIHVKGLTAQNTFSNAGLITGRAASARFGGTAIHENCRAYNFGEGIEIDVTQRAFTLRNESIFTDNLAGDIYELVNCDYGVWVGNRARHENGTLPPTGGGAVDAGGTLYAYLYDNDFSNTPGGFEATTTNTVSGFTNRRNIYTYSEGFVVRGTNNPGCLPGDGQSDWFGYEAESCGTGIYVRGSSTFNDQNHRFHAPRIIGGSNVLVHGNAKVTITDPYFTTTGIAIQAGRTSSFDGLPTIRVVRGEISSSGNAAVRVDGTGYAGIFRPSIELDRPNLTFSSGTGVVTSAGGISDASGVVFNNANFDSATYSRRTGVLAQAKVIVSATGQTRLLKIPLSQRCIPEAISIRAIDAASPSGSFTARIGSSAASYADVATSSTIELTTVGQQKFFTLNDSVAGPVGSGTGLDISIDVTSACSGYLRCEVELIGRLVGVPTVDDPANISSFRSWHRWPFNLYTDLGTTPATAVGDLIRRWSVYQGTALNLDAPADATRLTFGTSGVEGNGVGRLSASSVNLAGPYTMVYRIKVGSGSAAMGFLSIGTAGDSQNILIRSSTGICNFFASGDAAVTNYNPVASAFNVMAHAVTSGSVGTVYQIDGTIVNADGSSGSTPQANPSNFYVGSILTTGPMLSGRMISDILIYDKILTSAEFLRLKAMLEA